MARLSKELAARALDTIALYPQPRSALIPLCHLAQEQDGWLTPEAIEHIAELLGIEPAEVRGTASFYDMFFLHPVGTYLVSVCTNLACLLSGGYELLAHAEERLDVKPGGTTTDGVFTLEEVECIALCGNAPCATVNWRFFGDLDAGKLDTLLDDLKAGRLAETVPPHGTLNRVRRNGPLVTAAARASAGLEPERPAPSQGGQARPADGAADQPSPAPVAEDTTVAKATRPRKKGPS